MVRRRRAVRLQTGRTIRFARRQQLSVQAPEPPHEDRRRRTSRTRWAGPSIRPPGGGAPGRRNRRSTRSPGPDGLYLCNASKYQQSPSRRSLSPARRKERCASSRRVGGSVRRIVGRASRPRDAPCRGRASCPRCSCSRHRWLGRYGVVCPRGEGGVCHMAQARDSSLGDFSSREEWEKRRRSP